MKKLSYLIASVVLLSLHANSFAGTGDLPKATPNGEKIEIASPNDDPNAPPPSNTYYLITRNSFGTMSAAELAQEPNVYYTTSVLAVTKPATGVPTGGNLLNASAACRAALLSTAMCSGCHTWGTYYSVGLTVTTSNFGITPQCGGGL
jgi:hypothetical protein